jgi:hypothetical protein
MELYIVQIATITNDLIHSVHNSRTEAEAVASELCGNDTLRKVAALQAHEAYQLEGEGCEVVGVNVVEVLGGSIGFPRHVIYNTPGE